MMKIAFTVALCLALTGPCLAVIGFGKCPDTEVVHNFDVGKYVGKWYQLEKYAQFFEGDGRCNTAEYSVREDGKVGVHNAMIEQITGLTLTQDGYAELADSSSTDAKLVVTFDVPILGTRQAPYWVLDTDYDNYALVYTCKNLFFNIIKAEYAWVLSRTDKGLASEHSQLLEASITKAGLRRRSFRKTKQENC